jgi:signal peptidase I
MSIVLAPAPAIHPATRHAEPKAPAGHRLWRLVSGVFLVVLTAGSLAGMVTVIHDRIGFSPVLSPSMVPTFGPGDLIITKPELATDIKVGQIIALPVLHAPGQRYVHRVISVTRHDGKPVVQTKGDANPAPEQFALTVTSKYVPRVIAVIPKAGRLSLITQRRGLRLAIILLTAICALIAVKRLVLGVRYPGEPGESGDDQ